jgi:hypothetical protein
MDIENCERIRMSLARIQKALIIFIIAYPTLCWSDLSNYSKSDPYPRYTTLEPHQFLYTYYRDELKGEQLDFCNPECFGVFLSPFGQNANVGRNITNVEVPLGDLSGRTFMLGLLFGPVPVGQVLAPTLAAARATLFPSLPPNFVIDDDSLVDPAMDFGYFSIPLQYRKRGFRLETQARICYDFGIQVQVGISDICQAVVAFNNLTPATPSPFIPTQPNLTPTNVNLFLMDQLPEIAEDLGLDIDNFHQFSFEDVRVHLFWRHAYFINEFHEQFPKFLLIPFVQIGVCGDISKRHRFTKLFAVPFSNDNHNAFGFDMGLNIDFIETIEIGAHVGITHFFAKSVSNYPMPTDEAQSVIYPFNTDVTIHPGRNLLFSIKMNARHFLEMLSFYFEYVLIDHDHDKITLKNPDPAFVPHVLEERSTWKTQVANIGFNYDISPNISLGFLWQAPLSQRNSYRSSTVMIGFNTTF